MFVSSTFEDFHAERDLLAGIVFPELAERLGERWFDFEPVDLRLGVDTTVHADEAAKSRLVVQVCLQEVARSRPFVLGLIGDRYGWRVPDQLARMAAEEAGFAGATAGRSMTDLELRFGVFQEQDSRDFAGARVYLRTLDLSGAPDDVRARFTDSGADAERLRTLKEELLERLGPARCREYRATWDPKQGRVTGLGDFRAMVAEDLWRDLDAATTRSRVTAVGWQTRERAVLDEFLHDRAADFVGREALLRELSGFATTRQAAAGVCAVSGPPGSGKSSVVAELVRRLRATGDLRVLDHAAGISGVAGSVDTMLRRWLTELQGDAATVSVDGLGGADLEHAFARALTQIAAERPVLLVVDAVDELEAAVRARRMTWLPRIWPRGAKLIFTATPGDDVDAVVRRTGARRLEVGPLAQEEAAELVDSIYRRYRRTANREVKGAILAKRTAEDGPAHGSPLWLELVCQEMNLLNAEDFARSSTYPGRPDERLTAMQIAVVDELPATPHDMYLRMMRRAETVADMAVGERTEAEAPSGSVWLRGLVRMLALGRQGWRESDLRAVLGDLTGVGWNDLLFSSVRRVFRGHLVQRGSAGQWDFSHSQFRVAARQAYPLPPPERRDLHRRIAAHLTDIRPDDVHRQRELMHHLVGADDRQAAARTYARVEPESGEARAATESLAARYHAGPDGGAWLTSLLAQDGLGIGERLQLGHMMLRPLDERLTSDGVGTDERRRLLETIRDATAAEVESASDPLSKRLAERQHAVVLLRLADLAMDTGDRAAATTAYQRVVDIYHRAARGADALPFADIDLAVALERLGSLALLEGQPSTAKQHFTEGTRICERLIAEGYPDLGTVCSLYCTPLESLAQLSLQEGDPATAEAHYRRMAALEIHLTDSPFLTEFLIRTHVNFARLAESTDRLPEAAREYTQAEDIARRAAEDAPENVEPTMRWLHIQSSLGEVEYDRRRLPQAVHWHTRALEGYERIAALLPDDVPVQQNLAAALARYGDVLLSGQAPEAAREPFLRSLGIRTRISALLPQDVRAQRDLGLAYERIAALPDVPPEEAIGHLRRAVDVYRRLKDTRPDGEEEPRTLAIALFALGGLLLRIAPLEGTEVLGEAHSLLSDLRARGVTLNPEGKRVLAALDPRFGGSGRWTHTLRPDDSEAYAEANLQGFLGQQALNRGDFAAAEEAYGRAEELARSIDHPPSVARAMGSLGQVALARRDMAGAERLLRSAVEYARDHGLTDEESVTLSLLADLYTATGESERALRTTLDRIQLARNTGNVPRLANALGTAAEHHIAEGRFDLALPLLREAVEVFGQYRMHDGLANAYFYLGWALHELGDAEDAADAYLQHIALSPVPELAPLVNVGFLLAHVGRWGEAIEPATRALARLETEGTGPVDELRALIAECLRRRDAGE
nr:tetratricopeptide repeat protein [Streptomyces sp. SID13726]